MTFRYLLIINKSQPIYSTVNNLTKPVCAKCKHFEKSNFGITSGRCTLYADMDLVTGKVEFEYAAVARIDSNHCGPDGKYFELKE
jgi:hypothetical protein